MQVWALMDSSLHARNCVLTIAKRKANLFSASLLSGDVNNESVKE